MGKILRTANEATVWATETETLPATGLAHTTVNLSADGEILMTIVTTQSAGMTEDLVEMTTETDDQLFLLLDVRNQNSTNDQQSNIEASILKVPFDPHVTIISSSQLYTKVCIQMRSYHCHVLLNGWKHYLVCRLIK